MIKIGGRFLCSSAEGIREACLEGVGIALLSYWDVADGISSGALKIVSLTDATPLDLPIWALMPTSRHVPLRVRRFLDCLATSLNAHDPAHEWLGLNEKSSSLGDVETNAHTP